MFIFVDKNRLDLTRRFIFSIKRTRSNPIFQAKKYKHIFGLYKRCLLP